MENEGLNQKQLRKLKGLGQKLDACLKVGKAGLTPGFLKMVDDTMAHHELIKIRFDDHQEEKKELSKKIAESSGSHLVTIVGHVAVFYRENPDGTKRKIDLSGM